MADKRATIRTPWSNTIEIPVDGVWHDYPDRGWTNIELLTDYESMDGLIEWLDVQTETGRAEWNREGGRKWEINLSSEFTVRERN